MKDDINFLYEIGGLRKVPRAWQQVLSGKAQNVSEHIFRVVMIAWTIAVKEGADVNKIIKMALVHDVSESRATDIAFMHRDYVTRHEHLAIDHIFKNTTLEKEVRGLLDEYEERKSLESRILKDADNLDVDLELRELSKDGDSAALYMQETHRPHVRAVKLYTKTAKKMWDEIKKSHPDNWHRHLTTKWVKSKKGAR